MSGGIRHAARTALGVCALLAPAAPADAQEVALERTAASVDYVGVEGLYLAVGSDQGAVRGDTVAVYLDDGAFDPAGRMVFTSVTRRRAVATPIDATLRLEEGDVVFLPLVGPAAAAAALAPPSDRPEPPAVRQSPSVAFGPRISGRLALDFEARETRTAWSGDLFGETRRRFATPTTRLSLLASGLPGGVTVRANVRASYRYDELLGGPPPLSIRAYEVAAIKSFERVPLEIMLGRFGNPYESYSAYWDGALVRLGRPSGIGVGMAVGFEPELHNEAFSRALPKLTAFADFAARGGGWRYDTDASFHVVRPSFGAERHFVGWSQRLSLGRLAISQRLRVDEGPTGGAWSLTELRLRGSLDLVGPLRLRSTYRRSASTLMAPLQPMATSAVRREMTVGLDLSGGRGSLSVEGGRTDRGGEEPGWSLYGSAALRARGANLLLSGRRWTRGDAESWSLAPALSFDASAWEWRAGYRLYRTGSGHGTLNAHAAEGQVGVTVTRGMRVTLRGERQWGANLTGIRVRIGIWRSF